MPEEGIELRRCQDILSYEEILTACRAFASLGIHTIKITGGEPLVRLDAPWLIGQIKALEGIEQVTLTTNGILLAEQAEALLANGVDGINISLDTLDADDFARLTRRDGLEQVLAGIQRLIDLEYPQIKINCVPISGFNDDQLCRLASFAKEKPIAVRFIEMMPIGMGKHYRAISKSEIMVSLEAAYGALTPWPGKLGQGPAQYYSLPGFAGKIGFIGAVHDQFCDQCNRVRLTASGFLKLCLQYDYGVDISHLLRSGGDLEVLTTILQQYIYQKPKEHHFNSCDVEQDADRRNMFEIGG